MVYVSPNAGRVELNKMITTATIALLSHCAEVFIKTPFESSNHSFTQDPRQRTIVVDANCFEGRVFMTIGASGLSANQLQTFTSTNLVANRSIQENHHLSHSRNTPVAILAYRRVHAIILDLQAISTWLLP